MDRSLAKMIFVLSTIVALILVFIFSIQKMMAAAIITVAVWLVLYCVLARFLRCPNCGHLPGRDGLFAQYCPQCGEPLE